MIIDSARTAWSSSPFPSGRREAQLRTVVAAGEAAHRRSPWPILALGAYTVPWRENFSDLRPCRRLACRASSPKADLCGSGRRPDPVRGEAGGSALRPRLGAVDGDGDDKIVRARTSKRLKQHDNPPYKQILDPSCSRVGLPSPGDHGLERRRAGHETGRAWRRRGRSRPLVIPRCRRAKARSAGSSPRSWAGQAALSGPHGRRGWSVRHRSLAGSPRGWRTRHEGDENSAPTGITSSSAASGRCLREEDMMKSLGRAPETVDVAS